MEVSRGKANEGRKDSAMHRSTYFVHFLSQIFGIMVLRDRKDGTWERSRILIIWNALLVLATIAYQILFLWLISSIIALLFESNGYPNKHCILNRYVITKFIDHLVVSIIVFVGRINCAIQYPKRFDELMRKFESVDKILEKETARRNRFSLFALALLFMSLLVNVPKLIALGIFDVKLPIYTLFADCFNVVSIIMTEIELLYCLTRLRVQFQLINEKLTTLRRTTRYSYWDRRQEDAREKGRKNEETERISMYRTAHRIDYDILKMSNSMYEYFLLFNIGGNFVSALTYLYFLMLDSRTATSFKPNTMEMEVQCAKWLILGIVINSTMSLYYVFKLVLVVMIGSSTANEGKKIGYSVTRLMIRSNDTEVKEELNLFHDQTMLRDVDFSVVGLFRLRMCVISSLVTAGVTYFVILVQVHGTT